MYRNVPQHNKDDKPADNIMFLLNSTEVIGRAIRQGKRKGIQTGKEEIFI